MTDITCSIVVMKDRRFYSGVAIFANGAQMYRFSPHMYDAKRFKKLEKAHKCARQIGGYVRIVDRLNGEII